jgi:FMN phosphatase YigB (HAD superfamily)
MTVDTRLPLRAVLFDLDGTLLDLDLLDWLERGGRA